MDGFVFLHCASLAQKRAMFHMWLAVGATQNETEKTSSKDIFGKERNIKGSRPWLK